MSNPPLNNPNARYWDDLVEEFDFTPQETQEIRDGADRMIAEVRAQRLAEVRKRQNATPVEVAAAMGISLASARHVSRIEKGQVEKSEVETLAASVRGPRRHTDRRAYPARQRHQGMVAAPAASGDVVTVMSSGPSRCGRGSPDPARYKPVRRAHPTATAACSQSIATTGPAHDAWYSGYGRHGDSVPSRDQSG